MLVALLVLAVCALPWTHAHAQSQDRVQDMPQSQIRPALAQGQAKSQSQPSAAPAQAPAQELEYALTPRGYGGGGRFTCAAMDPTDPARVIVGSDVAGYFLSTDNGQSFNIKGAGLEGLAMAAVAVAPGSPRRMFFLTDDGLYVSEDRGENVTKISGKVRYNSRFFGSHLLLPHQGSWFAATDSDGVFKLDQDAGGAWIATPLFGLQGKKVNSLAVFRDRLTAATDEGVYVYDGEIWKNCNEGLPPDRRDMVDMTAHPSGRLYAVEKKTGFYAYDEGRNTWEFRGPNPASLPSQSTEQTFKALAVSPENPDMVLLATHPKSWPFLVLLSRDAGRTWTLVKRFALTSLTENWAKNLQAVEQIVFSPEKHVLFLMDWWNVWRSVDDGESWLQLHQGLQNTVVNDIQTHPTRPSVLYLATDDNGLMISKDNGRVWRRKMQGVPDGNATAVRLSAQNPDMVYLLVEPWKSEDTASDKFFHLFKSLDGGETWKAYRFRDKIKHFEKPYVTGKATNLVIDPTSDDVVYVGANGYGVYRVDTSHQPDGTGAETHAENISATMPTPYIAGSGALLVDPVNSKVMVAGTLEGGIFRTQDGGATWKPADAPKTFIFGMARDPREPNRLYATAAEKRLLTSVDGGITWKVVNLPGPRPPHISASAVTTVPAMPGTVVVGTSAYDLKAADGLYISKDYGVSFAKVSSSLPRVGVNVLTSPDRADGLALVGFNGIGLFGLTSESSPDGQ
jgi:photosystem II stability/assembly factor-like uncharacterized protein